MKIAIITSELTYVPENSFPFFEELVQKSPITIAGVIIVKNFSCKLLYTTLWLYWIGCFNLAKTLTQNILEIPKQKREKLFTKLSIPVFKVSSANDPKVSDWLQENNIDLLVNFRSREILKKEVFNAPRLGCINIHHGILPKYKGLFCDLYALYDGRPAGFSIHKMEEGVDVGEIFLTKAISKDGEKDYCGYLKSLAHEEASALCSVLETIAMTNKLPEGTPNTREGVVTKTPRKEELLSMKSASMLL